MTTGILDTFQLRDQVAIITGASSGLGAVIARAVAEAGADVVAAARSPEGLHRTGRLVEAAGRRYLARQTDVTNPEECEALCQAAVEAFGQVDVLVNNAGVGWAAPALRESPDEFRRVIDTNLLGQYWCAQAFARRATRGGSIVNISSVAGLKAVGLPQAAYASSKAGLIGLTRDLAAQWTGRKRIRVNAVAPGFIDAGMGGRMDGVVVDAAIRGLPAGRTGDAEEVATAVLFLASSAASYVTGTVLPVDGGLAIA